MLAVLASTSMHDYRWMGYKSSAGNWHGTVFKCDLQHELCLSVFDLHQLWMRKCLR